MLKHRKKPAHISQEDWDSVDVPDLTDEQWATARPLREVFPELAEWSAEQKRLRGRPPVKEPRRMISFRLPAALVKDMKAFGRGYNARVEKALKRAIAEGWF